MNAVPLWVCLLFLVVGVLVGALVVGELDL